MKAKRATILVIIVKERLPTRLAGGKIMFFSMDMDQPPLSFFP
jgi:hypothetical protein